MRCYTGSPLEEWILGFGISNQIGVVEQWCHFMCRISRMDEQVRLDKWLWAARFFKTRSMAREAVSGGKVRLNGNRAKPAKPLKTGDELRIQRGEEEFVITVTGLSERRVSAAIAQGLYEESEENRVRRERLAEERKFQYQQRVGLGRERRPDKRQRRRLIRFKNKFD